MRADVYKFCRSLVCASRKDTGLTLRPLLSTIPVCGPFNRMGVDRYSFQSLGFFFCVNFLTKWVEAYAMSDLCAVTTAQLFVILRYQMSYYQTVGHTSFLTRSRHGMCDPLGVKKVNRSGCLQTV